MSDEHGRSPFDDPSDARQDPRFRERLGDRLDALVPETVKKLALAGMGALFMTEEGIRNAVSDLKLPREAVNTLLSQTEKARGDLFRMIAGEVRKFLEEANIAGELRKVLLGLTIDVEAKIAFKPVEGGGVRPEMSGTKTKTSRKGEKQRPRKKAAKDDA